MTKVRKNLLNLCSINERRNDHRQTETRARLNVNMSKVIIVYQTMSAFFVLSIELSVSQKKKEIEACWGSTVYEHTLWSNKFP